MAYRVKGDAVTVHKALSELRNVATNRLEGYDTVGTVYPKGAVIHDNDVSPLIQKLVEEGDPHTSSLLEYVDDEEVNTLLDELSPEERARYDLAAQEARLGPYPLDVGHTGPTSAPGVIDPAAAAEKTRLQHASGQVADLDAPVESADTAAAEQEGLSEPKGSKVKASEKKRAEKAASEDDKDK